MAFSVTYDGNGYTGGSVPVDPKVYNTGQTVTLLGNINNLVKAGTTTFIYWNTDPNGAGNYYGWPGDTTLVMGAATITLYAQWCITDGLKSGGVTDHYSFSYDSTLQKTAANPNGIEP